MLNLFWLFFLISNLFKCLFVLCLLLTVGYFSLNESIHTTIICYKSSI